MRSRDHRGKQNEVNAKLGLQFAFLHAVQQLQTNSKLMELKKKKKKLISKVFHQRCWRRLRHDSVNDLPLFDLSFQFWIELHLRNRSELLLLCLAAGSVVQGCWSDGCFELRPLWNWNSASWNMEQLGLNESNSFPQSLEITLIEVFRNPC